MSKMITARFSNIDAAERAATALKHSLLSQHIEKLSISGRNLNDRADPIPFAVPFGMSGTTPYYSGAQNSMNIPFSAQYGIFLTHTAEAVSSEQTEQPEEALLRLTCSNSSTGKFHGKLISLGAYEIHIN